MKKLVKPVILAVLVAVFVTLVVLPINLSAHTLKPGEKAVIFQVDTCVCPLSGGCQCLFLDPPTD